MPDWLMDWLGQTQGGIVRSLAAELRAGGTGAALLAFTLGALHAMTPGHGKTALAAYFLGREAEASKPLRVSLLAALMHVFAGFAVFIAFRFVLHQLPSVFGRSPPSFTVLGYGLILLAGVVMILQATRGGQSHHDDAHALTAGIGLLPCPLTISVLGFAWTQSTGWMVAVVLASLSLGIAVTIGTVAAASVVARRVAGLVLTGYADQVDRWARILQFVTGVGIVALALYALGQVIRN